MAPTNVLVAGAIGPATAGIVPLIERNSVFKEGGDWEWRGVRAQNRRVSVYALLKVPSARVRFRDHR